MKLVSRTLLVALAAVAIASTAFGQDDVAGSQDYPGISRMPGYYIYEYTESPFDTFSFPVKEGGKQKEQPVEGRRYDFRYNLKDNATMPSPVQILRNYQNAARSAGGQVLFESGDATTIRLKKGGNEAWLSVQTSNIPSGMFIILIIVEKKAMQQEVTIDASAMASSIADNGSVAIYGINFDTAKSDIKPDSEPAIDEIAKLLTNNPALKVGIVGHTDMVGDATSNMRLSQARAQSVIADLIGKHGIAGARLVAFGAGPWAPVASNKTEDGRAKNRRVELVEIATK
jgi:outer membrane protein OmpA-like peptidoglycan-associated protein